MQVATSIRDVPVADGVYAVIINCSTKWFTTLALASTLKNTGLPVLVIDCESQDQSENHFAALSHERKWPITWLRWPFRPHWQALDQILAETTADRVLLVDSDVELTDPHLFTTMQRALDDD